MNTFLIVAIMIAGGVAAFFIKRLGEKTRVIASGIGFAVMFVLALTIAETKPFYASMLCLVGAVGFFKNYLDFKKLPVRS